MAKIKVSGEGIMQRAREMFYEDFDFNNAIQLLIDSLQNNEMTENEIKNLAIKILNGEAEIYDTDYGYDVRDLNPKDEKYDFYGMFSSCIKHQKELEYKFDKIVEMLAQTITNMPSFVIEGLNNDFYYKFGRKLWTFMPRGYGCIGASNENDYDEYYGQIGSPRWKQRTLDIFDVRNGRTPKIDASTLSPKAPRSESVLNTKELKSTDYINKNEREYGFITPNGEYIPISFGNHEVFAQTYIKENFKRDYNKLTPDMYWECKVYSDYLVYNKGFILLDNPSYGHAIITFDKTKHMSKEQKNALYDYLIAHDRNKEASELFDERQITV